MLLLSMDCILNNREEGSWLPVLGVIVGEKDCEVSTFSMWWLPPLHRRHLIPLLLVWCPCSQLVLPSTEAVCFTLCRGANSTITTITLWRGKGRSSSCLVKGGEGRGIEMGVWFLFSHSVLLLFLSLLLEVPGSADFWGLKGTLSVKQIGLLIDSLSCWL